MRPDENASTVVNDAVREGVRELSVKRAMPESELPQPMSDEHAAKVRAAQKRALEKWQSKQHTERKAEA